MISKWTIAFAFISGTIYVVNDLLGDICELECQVEDLLKRVEKGLQVFLESPYSDKKN